MITINTAREWLRIDGTENDMIIEGLLAAVPAYIETATGLKPEAQSLLPLAEVVTKFLLLLWYNPDGTDTEKLQKVIDGLLKSLSRVTA